VTHQSSLRIENDSVVRILDAAASCFGRRGYHGTSMQDVAREAKVSKSLLHYHFDSKEHIFLEVQLRVIRALRARVTTLVEGSTGGAPLHEVLEEVFAYFERDIDQIAILLELRNVLTIHPSFGTHLRDFRAEIDHMIVGAIHEVLGEAATRMILPPERLAPMLGTLFHGLMVDLAFAADQRDRDVARQVFHDFELLIVRAILGFAG
jgi:AcrR family transcriptional regulator